VNTLRRVPPNFFTISFGIAGLADVWSLAAHLYGIPAWIGDAGTVATRPCGICQPL
jgi:hypothetical protein